jgi:hypothetical protein
MNELSRYVGKNGIIEKYVRTRTMEKYMKICKIKYS